MKNKKFSIADFNTTNGETEGRKFSLETAAGEPTDEWVILYGLGSPAMKAAMATFKAKLKRLGKEASSEIDSPENCEFLAAAIKDWSLEDTCNYDNKLALITQCKTVREYINAVVQNTRLFFRLGHVPSWNPKDTPKDSSSSGSETLTV
jgi:hypothetical protein